jgi:hypothetical protein
MAAGPFLTSSVHRGLEPSTLKQNVQGEGGLPLGRGQSGVYTALLKAIRQGGAYPRTLRPYLIAAVCGPTWATMPLGEFWQPSKGEQYPAMGSTP